MEYQFAYWVFILCLGKGDQTKFYRPKKCGCHRTKQQNFNYTLDKGATTMYTNAILSSKIILCFNFGKSTFHNCWHFIEAWMHISAIDHSNRRWIRSMHSFKRNIIVHFCDCDQMITTLQLAKLLNYYCPLIGSLIEDSFKLQWFGW